MRQTPGSGLEPPHAKNWRALFTEACAELLTPFPSITLPDWPQWNEVTGGFRTREFTILCGSTGSGKTTYAANLSAQLLRQGTKHFIMSVETGHTDFMKRVMSVIAERDLNTGKPVSPVFMNDFYNQHRTILESDAVELSLYDNRVPVSQLISDLRYMAEVKGCRIAIIDNLNFFMEVTSAANQIIEMDRVIHELIIFCKQTDIHVIMVMHPKKTDSGRVLSEFDIKGSSTAVQEAHNVFLFNRPGEGSNPFDRELRVAKMRRRGAHVGKTILFECRGTRYVEKGYL